MVAGDTLAAVAVTVRLVTTILPDPCPPTARPKASALIVTSRALSKVNCRRSPGVAVDKTFTVKSRYGKEFPPELFPMGRARETKVAEIFPEESVRVPYVP